jgi:parallel beta-helix repeat protein
MALGLVLLGFDGLEPVPLARQEQRELIVCPEGCPFTSIQAAIDAAQDADVVKVMAGTYQETLFISKSITLRGESSNIVVLKPAHSEDSVVGIRTPTGKVPGSGPNSIITVTLMNITISGGRVGVDIAQASVNLLGNRILSSQRGVVAFGFMGELTLRENEISGDVEARESMGVFLQGEFTATLHRNAISDRGVGVTVTGRVAVEIRDNTVSENTNGLVIGSEARAQVEENRITDNSFVGIQLSDRADVLISRNEIRNSIRGVALWQRPCFPTDDRFEGSVQGSENQFSGNRIADLCPEDYPWPEGFKQP